MRGYRIVRPHPCKCGREGCLAWGQRKYSDECWENMPSHIKARMISRAMDASEPSTSANELVRALNLPEVTEPLKHTSEPYDWARFGEHSA